MGVNIVQKILSEHGVKAPEAGTPVAVTVDQVLTQDATGTMAYLQFEAMGVDRVQVPLAVSYVDHNMLQTNFRNPDDHIYLQTVAARYGAYFSRAGNGICHQVHLERFALPGAVLLGADSHTPTAGGMGSLAIGVGGLDIAAAMGGEPYELKVPKVVLVRLEGELNRPWVTAMDIILEMLRRLTVKGGVGKIFEYGGPGVSTLSLTERATITNMGAELGATTSIFPSDERTRRYLEAQDREKDWMELKADPDAGYDEQMVIDLSQLEPLIAKPHQPDNVVKIKEVAGLKVQQVCVGSCTNSSYPVMKTVASVLKGRAVHPDVTMTVTPGSRQVFEMIAREGDLADMIGAGARILESACGPCIGMGQAPPSGGVSVRSFNRNFKGRSGTTDAQVYLCSPLSAAAISLKGEIVDPRDAGIEVPLYEEPVGYIVNDTGIIPPPSVPQEVQVVKGPNIKDVPIRGSLEDRISAVVLLKLGDNITTDDILPAGAEILPLRSNIPAISRYVFYHVDPSFADRAKQAGAGILVGGDNYGQGSSREHAALSPMYLGVRAVIAKSFARIHRANLINFGIMPLTLKNPGDYGSFDQGDEIEMSDLLRAIQKAEPILVNNVTRGVAVETVLALTSKERDQLLAGGLLPLIRSRRAVY